MMRFFSLAAFVLIQVFGSAGHSTRVSSSGLSELPSYSADAAQRQQNGQISLQHILMLKKFHHFVKQGVPAEALRRAFEVFYENYGQTVAAKAVDQPVHVRFRNDRYLGIADYTQPSTNKRFYLVDLKTGIVETHYVSHGMESGKKWAQVFSNKHDSNQTSLGIFITGGIYQSRAFKGLAMKLFGLDGTNNNAYSRYIVVHQADYASPNWIKKLEAKFEETKDPKYTPRLGRSQGCFAFDPAVAQTIIQKLSGGALIYSYVKGAERKILESPDYQEVIRVNPADDVGEDTLEEILQRDLDKVDDKSAVKSNVRPKARSVKTPQPLVKTPKK